MTGTTSLEPLLDLRSVAAILGVSRTSVYAAMENGLPTVKLGGRRLVEPEALRRFVEEHREGGGSDVVLRKPGGESADDSS